MAKSRLRQRLAIASLVVLAAVTSGGCHVQAGPTVGYAFGKGTTLGWEAGGGAAYLRGNVGGSYRILDEENTKHKSQEDPSDEEPSERRRQGVPGEIESVHYVVFEPAVVTIGAAFRGKDASVAAGAWLGAPVWKPKGASCERSPIVTVALGYRYMADAHELYLTPKLLTILECPRFPL